MLLPVRNGGALLGPAVESILAQTLQDLELIVIDDHSADGAVQALPRTDPRLRIAANPGRGLVAALNVAAALARAPLLARMDADDIALEQRLQRQLEHLERYPALGIVGAEVEIFRDDGPLGEGYRRYQRWINGLREPAAIARAIFIESPIPHPTALIRREVFARLGGYRDRGWAEDYDLWLRAHADRIAMGKPAGVLLRWRDSDGRCSRVDARYRTERFLRAKAHFLARTLLGDHPVLLWGAGETGAQLCDALDGEGARVVGFIDVDPRKIGGRKRGRPVLDPQAGLRREEFIVVAVGARGARSLIRPHLCDSGREEGEDFVFAA